jgi:hypothetical protein
VASDPVVRQKLDALRELQAEKAKRERESRNRAYVATIKERGEIPRIVLDGPDQDEQRERLLAELGAPDFHVERVVIDPPPAVERHGEIFDRPQMRDVTPETKAFVEDNVRRMEARAAAPKLPPPKTSSADVNHCATAYRGEPVWFYFDVESRMVTLTSHDGRPVLKGEELYRAIAAYGENPDEVAIRLWLRWRGKKEDADESDFDFDIIYPHLRLPRGA